MKTIYETIIVGIDNTERAHEVLEKAVKVAKTSEANFIVVSSIPYNQIVSFNYVGMDPMMVPQYMIPEQDEIKELVEEREDFVNELLKEIDTTGIPSIKKVINISDPDTKIIELAKENKDALIIVGSSDKKAIERLILGSVARQILHTAPVDVLLVR